MTYFSLFSGIGGFELGIGEKGTCVGFSEVEPHAIDIYQKHFPTHKNYGDITKINAEELPDFDLLVGGFPCQSFSIAGNRGGFGDTRGTLFFDIARIIESKKPSHVLLENVRGLLTHDGGETFKTIIRTLDELGYDTEWGVFDGTDFGAGQRPRLFIHASHRDDPSYAWKGTEQTLPIYTCLSERSRITASALQEAGGSAERIIRAFAVLPDWMDSWETIYSEEGKIRECCAAKRGESNNE